MKALLNPILDQLSGVVGERLAFRRHKNGVVLAHRRKPGSVAWTEAQITAQKRFRQAAEYSKKTLADPAARAFYEAAAEARDKPLASLTMADFLNAPTIEQIDLDAYQGHAGDVITVTAYDDLGVTGVTVRVTDTADNTIEVGPAVESPAGSGRWVYQAQTTLEQGMTARVAAVATDRPGGLAQAFAAKTI